jgi:hypothetical protein
MYLPTRTQNSIPADTITAIVQDEVYQFITITLTQNI